MIAIKKMDQRKISIQLELISFPNNINSNLATRSRGEELCSVLQLDEFSWFNNKSGTFHIDTPLMASIFIKKIVNICQKTREKKGSRPKKRPPTALAPSRMRNSLTKSNQVRFHSQEFHSLAKQNQVQGETTQSTLEFRPNLIQPHLTLPNLT